MHVSTIFCHETRTHKTQTMTLMQLPILTLMLTPTLTPTQTLLLTLTLALPSPITYHLAHDTGTSVGIKNQERNKIRIQLFSIIVGGSIRAEREQAVKNCAHPQTTAHIQTRLRALALKSGQIRVTTDSECSLN